MTRLRPLTPVPAAPLLEEIAAVIRRGGVIGLPTESSYGLAADPHNPDAVARVCELKGRPAGMPILVLIGDPAQMRSLVREIPTAARTLIEHFWPGPLTIVLPAASGLPNALTAGTGTIGVRWPAYRPIQSVLQTVGPMTGTSANVTGAPALMTAQAVETAFGATLDLILDAPVGGGAPSTVIEAVGELKIVREGAVRFEQIAAAMRPLGVTVHGGGR